MDKRAIKECINSIIKTGISPVDERDDPKLGHRFGQQLRSMVSVSAPSQEVIMPLYRLLLEQEDLHWLIGGAVDGHGHAQFSTLGGGGVGILPIKVTNWLLAKSLSLDGGIDEAIEVFENFLEYNTVTGIRVCIVSGIWVEKPVKINDEIWISPFYDLPPSLGRDGLEDFLEQGWLHLPMKKAGRGPALAAIAQRFEMSPAVHPSGGKIPEWVTQNEQEFTKLKSVAYATALLDEAMPQVLGRWLQTEAVDSIPGLTGGASADIHNFEILPKKHTKVAPLNAAQARRALKKRLEFNKNPRLEIALPRLALARTRRELSDRAIEIAITLEALLGDIDKNEIVHRIAVRGAVIGSKNKSIRMRNFQLIKRVYDLRSMIVHGGTIKRGKTWQIDGEKLTTEKLIDQIIPLTCVIANKLISKKEYPNWKDIDLGL